MFGITEVMPSEVAEVLNIFGPINLWKESGTLGRTRRIGLYTVRVHLQGQPKELWISVVPYPATPGETLTWGRCICRGQMSDHMGRILPLEKRYRPPEGHRKWLRDHLREALAIADKLSIDQGLPGSGFTTTA